MKRKLSYIALLALPVMPTLQVGVSIRAMEPSASPQKPGFTIDDLKAQIPLTPEGRFLMEIPQILNTSTDRAVQAILARQEVETTGQLITDGPAGKLRIYRAELLCCAAHIRKCSVALEFEGDSPDAAGSPWVTLSGVLDFRTELGTTTPWIRVRGIKKTLRPAKALLP